jgi:hypothetical protein
MSHVHVMRSALNAGAPHALVFEDDAVFGAEGINNHEAWQEAARFIKSHTDWDILLLGWGDGGCYRSRACKTASAVPGYTHILSARRLLTHAVVYSKRFMERMVRQHAEYPGFEIDDFFVAVNPLAMYIVDPELVEQRDLPSTIETGGHERDIWAPGEVEET